MNVRNLSKALWGAWELYGLLSWLGGLALSNAVVLTLWDDYKARALAVQILGGAGLALFMIPLSVLFAHFIGGLTASDIPDQTLTATGASQAVAQTRSPHAVAVHIEGNVIGGDYLAVAGDPQIAQESSPATSSPDTWVALAVERVVAWTEEIRR